LYKSLVANTLAVPGGAAVLNPFSDEEVIAQLRQELQAAKQAALEQDQAMNLLVESEVSGLPL
jgi:hypothetical protein